MQAAEKRAYTGEIDAMLLKLGKLQRVAEVAAQLKDTYDDKFASYNEKEYALDKLSEALEEYELFLEGY